MKPLVLSLAMAMCACTSQQYAQFNQRLNGSIARTLGTQTEPPTPSPWKSETAIDYVAAPTPPAKSQADAAYASHIVGMGAVPTVAFSAKPEHKQPTAKGIDLVDGAIVCPSMEEANWMFGRINSARHARINLSTELRKQAALVNGYDEGAEPHPSDYRCEFVPAGTPMTVESGNGVPVVHGVMENGLPFAGVTLPAMVSR